MLPTPRYGPGLHLNSLLGIRAGGAGGEVWEADPAGQHREEHSDGERAERVGAGGHGEPDGAAFLLCGYDDLIL